MIELLAKRVWYRSRAKIKQRPSTDTSLEAPSTAYSSPATKLPLEIVEMIITHLIYDMNSLIACSLTCYSWYIASVPHLHHTLVTWTRSHQLGTGWYTPLQNAGRLGLLPLVKKFCVYGNLEFSPKQFNRRILSQFSALTNVQDLKIYKLDIASFMPRIRRYFGHFLPTVRSLTLSSPGGSHRQIIFFIGLFQHLEDLTLYNGGPEPWGGGAADDPTLVPSFTPPLRGRLVVVDWNMVGLMKDMIHMFGGIRFRYVNIGDVGEARLLLGACAETLETLQLNPAGPYGKQSNLKHTPPPANDHTARSSLLDFDLSRNKSLRTLEVRARSMVPEHACGSNLPPNPTISVFLRTILPTITSPVFSEVIVIYRENDFCGLECYPLPSKIYRDQISVLGRRKKEYLWHRELFNVFREMYTLRNFRLVLCADVWDRVGEYAMRVLEQAVVREGFNFLPPETLVIYSPRGTTNIWDTCERRMLRARVRSSMVQ